MRKMKAVLSVAVLVSLAGSAAAQSRLTIAYASPKGIFVMGESVKQLTSDANAMLSERSWSPDGTRLLFYTYRRTKADDLMGWKYDIPFHFPMYVTNADGLGQQRLLDVPVLPDAVWSPDGKKIAFSSAFEQRTATGVYVLDVATKDVKRIAERGMWPSWSPDSKRVLFAAGVNVTVADADGSNVQSLARLPIRVASPVWSPDGKRIAFVSSGWWTMNADGTQLEQKSTLATTAVRFSPDSKRILVVAQGSAYVVDADGSNSHAIQETRGRILDASFSPDGRRVLYRVHAGADLLRSVNADGTDTRTLSDNIGERALFAVSPRAR